MDNFNGTTSTSCNNPVKPLTKEIVEEAIEAMKRDMQRFTPKFKLNMSRMIGFNSTTFSRIHTT